MPAGTVCECGALTRGNRCDRCHAAHVEKFAARRSVYDDPRWHACRVAVWIRDLWTCVVCGHQDVMNQGRSLDANHLRGVLTIISEGGSPFDPALCETRCKRCHGGYRTSST